MVSHGFKVVQDFVHPRYVFSQREFDKGKPRRNHSGVLFLYRNHLKFGCSVCCPNSWVLLSGFPIFPLCRSHFFLFIIFQGCPLFWQFSSETNRQAEIHSGVRIPTKNPPPIYRRFCVSLGEVPNLRPKDPSELGGSQASGSFGFCSVVQWHQLFFPFCWWLPYQKWSSPKSVPVFFSRVTGQLSLVVVRWFGRFSQTAKVFRLLAGVAGNSPGEDDGFGWTVPWSLTGYDF